MVGHLSTAHLMGRMQIFVCEENQGSFHRIQILNENKRLIMFHFLLELFEAGLGYSSINTSKSMLSTFVSEPREVGKNILVKNS